jgi:hypothetical protein
MADVMLTTIDNPHSPFTQWEEWYAFDVGSGYNTCAFLARIAKTSHDQSESDYDLAIEQAIDEIVNENVLGVYRKVERSDYSSSG